MKTIVVEIKDEKALPALMSLEASDLIKLHPSPPKRKKAEKGSLRGTFSKEEAEELHRQLKAMREEWRTDT